jgi:hypothetical protein
MHSVAFGMCRRWIRQSQRHYPYLHSTVPRNNVHNADGLPLLHNFITTVSYIAPEMRYLHQFHTNLGRQIRNTSSSSSSFTSSSKLILPSSSKLILPSTDGLNEWREMVELQRIEEKQKEAGEIVQPLVEQMYTPSFHLPSAPTNWSNYEPSTPITEKLIALIGVSGRPISTADFMRTALTHPEHGYYTNAATTRHIHHIILYLHPTHRRVPFHDQ